MNFSELELGILKESVQKRMGESRYSHTLGVEEAAIYLGKLLLPEQVSELRAAALLHDITKEITYEEHIKLLDDIGLKLTDEDLQTRAALHSFSAVPMITEQFNHYATPNILSAVENHTLGRENMSTFDKIIFIADFIEAGRAYEGCKRTAEYIKHNLKETMSEADRLIILDEAILMSIDFTIKSVLQRNQRVHSRTLQLKKNINKHLF